MGVIIDSVNLGIDGVGPREQQFLSSNQQCCTFGELWAIIDRSKKIINTYLDPDAPRSSRNALSLFLHCFNKHVLP